MSRRKATAVAYPSTREIKASPVPDRAGKENARRDLGLDLSVSCVGWAFAYDRQVLRQGKLVFKSTAKTGEKLDAFEKFLQVLIQTYHPSRIIVERPSLRRGNTTARHFEQLGVTRKVWFEETSKEILKSWLIRPNEIKKLVGVPTTGDHDRNKEVMVNHINKIYNLGLHYDINTPKDKEMNDDDIADAVAVLIAHWAISKKK